METKQISNYLVKLDGFKSGPDKSPSAMGTKTSSGKRTELKNAKEEVGRFQVAKLEATARSALSRRKSEAAGNKSFDP